ncbi:hypothetical protein [Pedobacter sp.]|uniref:hypothetical protein n=1 Tax=Pedobacter sp. TaxID=1411316 RepID=UPI003BABC161
MRHLAPGCSGTLQQGGNRRSEAYKRKTGANLFSCTAIALQIIIISGLKPSGKLVVNSIMETAIEK